MPLKIIGASFGRTGTESTKMALNQLGFKCYHMSEVIKGGGKSMQQWIKATDHPSSVNWDNIFEGYDATVDWPGSYFWKTLMDYYPDAKIVLNVRDADKWYESVHNTLYKNGSSFILQLATMLLPNMWYMGDLVNKIIWIGTFNNRFLDKSYTIEIFNTHNEEVKRLVSQDRLLLFDVKQGWKPLCTFLNVPIPETPFPNVNDRHSMNRKFSDMKRIVYILSMFLVAILGIILFKVFL